VDLDPDFFGTNGERLTPNEAVLRKLDGIIAKLDAMTPGERAELIDSEYDD